MDPEEVKKTPKAGVSESCFSCPAGPFVLGPPATSDSPSVPLLTLLVLGSQGRRHGLRKTVLDAPKLDHCLVRSHRTYTFLQGT